MSETTFIGDRPPKDGRRWDRRCARCGGEADLYGCLASKQYCEANPRPGREGFDRHAIEWFVDSAVQAVRHG